MKSLEELRVIREKMQGRIGVRSESSGKIKVMVGIASGERSVLTALSDAVQEQGLTNIHVIHTECIELSQYEPIMEVLEPGREKVTYVKMTPQKALEVLKMHLQEGRVVTEYTLGAAESDADK